MHEKGATWTLVKLKGKYNACCTQTATWILFYYAVEDGIKQVIDTLI